MKNPRITITPYGGQSTNRAGVVRKSSYYGSPAVTIDGRYQFVMVIVLTDTVDDILRKKMMWGEPFKTEYLYDLLIEFKRNSHEYLT